MIPEAEFRARFKEFSGAETYSRFVKALHHKTPGPRQLRFWQQDLWESFLRTNPDCSMTVDDLKAVLRICELHEVDLVSVEVPAVRECIDYDPSFIAAMAASFPHATPAQVMVGDTCEWKTATVWTCAACDEVQNCYRWNED